MLDLRQLMRTALQTSNDVQMIEVLQVGREEMPEAIKTLQRALEREVERESSSVSTSVSSAGLGARSVSVSAKAESGREGRRASLPGGRMARPVSGLERRKTVASAVSKESPASASTRGESVTISASTSGGSGSGSEGRPRDTLDREFIESGIDALRRVSTGADRSLPSWTITK